MEDHLKQLREEDGLEDEDDEAGWDNWDVESDSSEDSDESGGWIDVDDNKEDLDISDSEDEKNVVSKDKEPDKEDDPDPSTRVSSLATTKVCSSLFARLSNQVYSSCRS